MPDVIDAGRLQELVAQHTDRDGLVHLKRLTAQLEDLLPAPGQLPTQFQALTGVPKVLALIPARSGSKSVPHKNIRMIGGSPLIHHSIKQAQQSKLIRRVIVSTDSDRYRQVALDAGAEAPFLRPAAMAADLSPDVPAFQHALAWLKEHEGYTPDIVVHLRPTCPVRSVKDIDTAIEILLNRTHVDSVRSVSAAVQNPYRMWTRVNQTGMLIPIAIPPPNEVYTSYSIGEAGNSPRQLMPEVWMQNCCIEVVRASVILNENSMTGKRVYGLITPKQHDIDTEEDFEAAMKALDA